MSITTTFNNKQMEIEWFIAYLSNCCQISYGRWRFSAYSFRLCTSFVSEVSNIWFMWRRYVLEKQRNNLRNADEGYWQQVGNCQVHNFVILTINTCSLSIVLGVDIAGVSTTFLTFSMYRCLLALNVDCCTGYVGQWAVLKVWHSRISPGSIILPTAGWTDLRGRVES